MQTCIETNSTIINNQWIKEEIKKYFDMNENEDTSYTIQKCAVYS